MAKFPELEIVVFSHPLRIARTCLLALYVLTGIVRMGAREVVDGDFGFPIITSFGAAQIHANPATYCVRQGPDGVLYFGGDGLLSYDGDRWTMTQAPGLSAIYSMDFGPDGRLWIAAEGEVGWFEHRADGEWEYHSLSKNIPADLAIRGQVFHIFADATRVVFVTSDRVYSWDGRTIRSWPMPGCRRLPTFRINGEIYVHWYKTGLYRLTSAGPELAVPQALIGTPDRAGLLWIDSYSVPWLLATAEGLVAYSNGHSTPVAPDTSEFLRNAALTCGTRLQDGRYAFGTLRAGIIITDATGRMLRRISEADGVPSYINSLFVDREGLLWATSPTGIQQLNLARNTRIFDQRASVPPRLYRTLAGEEDRVAIGNTQGVLVLGPDRQHFSKLDEIGGGIHDLTTSSAGVLIGAFGGVWVESPSGLRQIYHSRNDVQFAVSSIRHPGETLISEHGGAIVRLAGDGVVHRIVQDLPSPATSLYEDRAGGIWIGTDTHGVLYAAGTDQEPAKAVPVPGSSGIPPIRGLAVVRGTPAGAIYVISDQGAWQKLPADSAFRGIRNYPVRPVAAVSDCLPDGTLWIASAASGSSSACVGRVSDGKWMPHSVPELNAVGEPRSILAGPGSAGSTTLWIGGSNAVMRHVVEHGPEAPIPASPLLRAFFRTAQGQPKPIPAIIPYSTPAIEFEFSVPQFSKRALLHLETRIDGMDDNWVPTGHDSRRELTAVRDGKYKLHVRAVAETGAASEPTVFTFEVAPPWWRSRSALIAEFLALAAAGYGAYRLRVRALHRRTIVLEQKVRERTEELAEASAAKTQFVANMSHDIRNPLNGIIGLALALEDTRLDTQQREIVATLRECTTYLSSLVDDVLDFASIEAGRVELRPGPYVTAELLNSIVTAMQAETTERRAFITIEADPDVPRVLHGDAGRIQQILVNYVSNSLKYAGGHIRLTAAISDQSPDIVEYSVIDEGPGITESEQATLFTKFTRLADARASHIPGTGLGLASCRLLADIMGGAVGVESSPGNGARFYLRLPLAVAVEPTPPPADVIIPHTSVLLVEDADYNAIAASAVLRRLGLSCDRARNGEEALRLFREKRHSIVLLDRNLPDMDGTEIARRMREMETDGLRAVLLAVTAYCTAEDRELSLCAGMDAFVGKPLTPDKLRKVLIGVSRQLLSTAAIAAPTETPSADVNFALLDYLAEGQEGGLGAQVERYISALREARDALFAVASGADLKATSEAAHRLLGHARMIGATRLSDVAARLETAARTKDSADVTLTLPLVDTEVAALTAALRRRPGVQRV